MALVGQISGSSRNNSSIGITGSVVIANRPAGTFPQMPGTDVVFFVSGSSFTGTDYASFGGDLIVSGSIISYGDFMEVTGTLSVTNGISGSLTQLWDGRSYMVAGSGIQIASASNGQVTISTTGGGSALTLQFLAGTLSSTAASGTMESVGMSYLDQAAIPGGSPTYTFSAILAPTLGTTAYIDLYDYDGIINGTPGPIAGAVLTGSSLSYTHLTADLTSQFNLASTSGIIEARIWCTPNGAGLDAICKSAKLTIA